MICVCMRSLLDLMCCLRIHGPKPYATAGPSLDSRLREAARAIMASPEFLEAATIRFVMELSCSMAYLRFALLHCSWSPATNPTNLGRIRRPWGACWMVSVDGEGENPLPFPTAGSHQGSDTAATTMQCWSCRVLATWLVAPIDFLRSN